jgi:acyl carrier protein
MSVRLLELVRGAVASVLNVPPEEVEPDAGFFDLGMDSAMATAFVQRLETAVGQDLSATLLFDYPTARSLAAHLSDISDIKEPGAAHVVAAGENGEGLLRDLYREIAAARAMRDTRGAE